MVTVTMCQSKDNRLVSNNILNDFSQTILPGSSVNYQCLLSSLNKVDSRLLTASNSLNKTESLSQNFNFVIWADLTGRDRKD
jgi:hypothetical protein